MTKPRAMFVLGTRPEVIKLAPVIAACRAGGMFEVVVCATGQHRQMLRQALNAFGLTADVDLELMTENQTVSDVTSRALTGLEAVYRREKPSIVLVQGDTTTAMAGALAAFYLRIPVAHIEAGLRTGNSSSPFPEEINRRLIGSIASIHLAPTATARTNLLREGVPDSSIFVTGNTAIDALLGTVERMRGVKIGIPTLSGIVLDDTDLEGKRVVLLTAHRRENHATGLRSICEAITKIAALPDAIIVFPVHYNPNVRSIVLPALLDVENVYLTDPLEYGVFSQLMAHSFLILTDSGGIQEEAPSLGTPVLVMRDTTERHEGIAAGNAVLVGTSTDEIVAVTSHLWSSPTAYQRMASASNPYGDGHAADKIVEILSVELVETPRRFSMRSDSAIRK